ncbi:conserved hypothetical protein, partial [Streptomyces sp. e14]
MSLTAPPEGDPQHPPRLARPDALPLLDAPPFALPGPDGLADFWADVRRRGTPLVSPDPLGGADHRAVTFLWRGTPATRAVQVLPNKLGDPRAPEGNLMRHVAGTDVWHWTLRLRADWRGTYDLYVDEGDGPAPGEPGYWPWLRGQVRTDPYNSRTLPRRWGGQPVGYAELPDAPRAVDWEPRPEVPRGTVTEHVVASELLGDSRRVWLYEPAAEHAGRAAGGLPVLLLLDGEHWQPRLGLARLLDNLIADGRVPPLAAVLPESVDAGTRWGAVDLPAGVRGLPGTGVAALGGGCAAAHRGPGAHGRRRAEPRRPHRRLRRRAQPAPLRQRAGPVGLVLVAQRPRGGVADRRTGRR